MHAYNSVTVHICMYIVTNIIFYIYYTPNLQTLYLYIYIYIYNTHNLQTLCAFK